MKNGQDLQRSLVSLVGIGEREGEQIGGIGYG